MIGLYLIVAFIISVLFFLNRKKIVNNLLIFFFLFVQWGYIIWECIHMHTEELYYFRTDALGILFLITLGIIVIPTFLHNYTYIYKDKDNPKVRSIYYAAMTILVAAISAAYVSSHIAVTWIFTELTTLSVAALVFHSRNSGSLEATWKYIFVCTISITLVFIGILFLSIAIQSSGTTDLSYDALLNNASKLNQFWLKLAFIFIFTGYTAKLGLVPMYTAGIDAKDKAPAPAGALLSSILVMMGFVGIFRFYVIITHTSLHHWASNILLIAALISVFISAVYMMRVKNIKRMLAYSSVEHMGIVMIGMACGGIGYYAAILHIIFHAFTKSALFLQIGQVYSIFKTKSIYYLGSYFKYNLSGTYALLIGFICISAMPPSGLFFSELMIIRSLMDSHLILILLVLLILLTVIIWAFGKNMFKLLFTPPVGFDEHISEKIRPFETYSQLVLLGIVIYLGLNPPSQFVDLIHEICSKLV